MLSLVRRVQSYSAGGGFPSGSGMQPYSPKRHNRWHQTLAGLNRGLIGKRVRVSEIVHAARLGKEAQASG